MSKSQQIQVLGIDIQIQTKEQNEYISLTDIAKWKNSEDPRFVIQKRFSTKYTIQFLWLWEELHNVNFNRAEFGAVRNEAGINSFSMSPDKRIKTMHAIGITSKSGRYWGWTFAHKDIAFEFASWISPEFKLYLIKEFQRLKEQEVQVLDWNVKRFLTKINYKIHTDAIKENLIPAKLTKNQINFVYADEADLLNVALFGQTAKEWREKNPNAKWNMRDETTIEQLIVLANIESLNAEYIKLKLPQSKRLELLNKTSISQMKSLLWYEINKSLPLK